MRVVFDTNVLLVALPSHSPFHVLYQAVMDERLTLFVTTETLAEYEEQISRRLGVARTDVHRTYAVGPFFSRKAATRW